MKQGRAGLAALRTHKNYMEAIAMDLQRIRVRQNLERMVINYFIRNEISEEQSNKICDFIDDTIGGGFLPQAHRSNGCTVIPFPTSYAGPETARPAAGQPVQAREIHAPYGEPLPEDVQDFRETLQRDGLALIWWEKLQGKEGTFYDVLWVKSSGNKRLTCRSGSVREEALPHVMPGDNDHHWRKPEAVTVYTVKVATDDVLHGPFSEFPKYIQSLKDTGLKNNFDLDFNFTLEKRNRFLERNKELIDLKIPPRLLNILDEAGMHTARELQKIPEKKLRSIPGMGEATINETIAILKKTGITVQQAADA